MPGGTSGTGAGAGSGIGAATGAGANNAVSDFSFAASGLVVALEAAGAVARSVATHRSDRRDQRHEGEQAGTEHSLVAGVWGIGRYMGSPYRIGKSGPAPNRRKGCENE